MSPNHRFRNGGVSMVGVVLMLAFAPSGAGQSNIDRTGEPEADEPPEEIVVYGDKSIIVLRNELFRAEEEFFSVFNSLNSNDDFDIKCNKETFLGTRRKHHICRPQFALKFEAQGSLDMSLSNKSLPVGLEPWDYSTGKVYESRIKRKEQQLWAEMGDLVDKNPELQKELVNLRKANEALNAERERRRND